jgi:hypothetical protein
MKILFGTVTSIVLFVVLSSCATLGAGAPPLHKAIESGNLAKVKKLIDGGADINETYGGTGNYPLTRAVKHPEIAVYLLSKQAKGLEPALREAISQKNYELAKMIVEAGADINKHGDAFYRLFSNNTDVPFEQQLQIAGEITGNKLNTPSILIYIDPENYQTAVDTLGMDLSEKVDELGRSALHLAAGRANFTLVSYLLDNKAAINALDDNNQTALFYAITAYGPEIDWKNPITENETTARIKFISDMPYYGDGSERQRRQVNIVMAFLDAGINVNQQNKQGWTVLHFASAAYPEGLQELLIEHNANKDLKTEFGRTADDILQLRNK